MAIDQLSLTKRNTVKGRKPSMTQKKILRKRPFAVKYQAKKVHFENPKKSTSQEKKAIISVQGKSCVMERAEKVQASLAAEFPSFVKPMLPSHVTGGFWLSCPKIFTDVHLPKHDDTVVLVDENEEEYETKYLVVKNGLSGGWRGFSIAHKLLEGDVLVFQLIEPCKFRVYIVRINGLDEIDGAIGLLSLDACAKPLNSLKTEIDTEMREIEGVKCLYNTQENGMVAFSTDLEHLSDQSGNDSDEFGSEILEGIRFSESVFDFKDVKSIDSFNILVDGLVIDSEIPKHLRIKYYELCCSQKAFLHDRLLEGLNCKLAAGVIAETVNIADAIRASKFTNSRENFTTWDHTLKAFEGLGMKVGFLRTRLNRLMSLAFDSKLVLESKRIERVKAEEEMRNLEERLLEVKNVIRGLDVEIEALKVKGERLEDLFMEEAKAPW